MLIKFQRIVINRIKNKMCEKNLYKNLILNIRKKDFKEILKWKTHFFIIFLS